MIVFLIFEVVQYVVCNGSKHFGCHIKNYIRLQLTSKYSAHNLPRFYVFIAEHVFGVVVGDKSTIHISYLQLECVFN